MRPTLFASLSLSLAAAVSALLGASPVHAAAVQKGLTVDDMLAMQRISEPAVSPDGASVVFTVRETDLDANRGRTDLWLLPTAGGAVRRLTSHPDADGSAAFSADGTQVYFLSSRAGSSQVWRIAVAGGEAEQVTKLPLDVNGFRLFADGRILLAMDVYPDARTVAETKARDDAAEKDKVKVHAADELLYRHWDSWEDGKYSHLFVWSSKKPDDAVDLTKGQRTDSPTHPFGGMEETSISPDGKSVLFVARVPSKPGAKDIAWTTNTDVFLVSSDGKGKPVVLTDDNDAYEFSPTFSPDGKSIALLAMARPGYEADRTRIAILDVATKKRRVLTEAWDRSPGSLTWSADGKTLFTSADHVGNHALFSVDVATGKEKLLVDKGTNQEPRIAGSRVVFMKDTLKMPVELFSMNADGSDVKQLSHFNDARVAAVAWGAYEQFSFKGAKGDTVHGYVMKPAGYKAGKAPVAFLVHGGPQGSFGDHFHYRWNPQAYAGAGYAVVFIDFHGSTGYGQAFTDAINGDWGGAPYEDLMKGLDFAIEKFPFLDKDRMAALGASYGGYMINWIHGQTDRFKAFVCHDGNLDERMAYFDTEELWFPEWEHGGTPWNNPQGYTKHNPIDFVKNWSTPTLVIHGGRDFRVVDTQGMSTFTALQRKGVVSRFLHFPEENHWVLKPHNSKRWHQEVLGWLDKHAKKSKPSNQQKAAQ
jgi:dipeptidyl aminopeptidase/acylaminoacyl peptidase